MLLITDLGRFISLRDWATQVGNIDTHLSLGPFHMPYRGGTVGLIFLDLSSKDTAVRFDAFMHQLVNDRFTLSMRTWGGPSLYNAGVCWMRFPSIDDSLCFGHYEIQNTIHDPPTRNILFGTYFDSENLPKVLVGIRGFDLSGKEWTLATSVNPETVTSTGFDLTLESPGKETEMHWAKAMWIATSRKDAVVGVFEGHGSIWSGYVEFPPGTNYIIAPALFTAISAFNVDGRKNFRVNVITTPDADGKGFAWKIDTWQDTKLIQVKVSYLALGFSYAVGGRSSNQEIMDMVHVEGLP